MCLCAAQDYFFEQIASNILDVKEFQNTRGILEGQAISIPSESVRQFVNGIHRLSHTGPAAILGPGP
jgi:hypothetical protein